jgi:hypothetical protein
MHGQQGTKQKEQGHTMTDEIDDTIDSGWEESSSFPAGHPSAHIKARHPEPGIVSTLYREAAQPLRARMLRGLLSPLTALSVVGVAAGAFAGFLTRPPQAGNPQLDDMLSSYTPQQIADLAAFVEDVDPAAVANVTAFAREQRTSCDGRLLEHTDQMRA